MVHDEDASNEKDGLWKRLNTLLHYNIEDGAKMELTVSKEKDISMLSDCKYISLPYFLFFSLLIVLR